jgi:hypothetical protein
LARRLAYLFVNAGQIHHLRQRAANSAPGTAAFGLSEEIDPDKSAGLWV